MQPRDWSRLAILCLASLVLAACGGRAASPAAQHVLASRFAHDLVAGRVASAQALLVRDADPVVPELVRRLAAPARRHPGVIRSRGADEGNGRWTFTYFRKVTKPDGSFTRETGQVVVDLSGGHTPAVRFFGFRNREISYSTHHDAQLLPSKR
jgi:hypothetical protein